MTTTKTPGRWMRGLLVAGMVALLLSCGGGGGGGGSATALPVGTGSGPGASGTDAGGSGTGTDGTGTGTGTGTGAGGTSGTDGGTSTAGISTGDGSGVGSGGTGVSADAGGIGGVDGLGSVILNGLRYNTDSADFSLEDTAELQIGMSARIAGKVDADFTSGTATQVVSAAELRGTVSGIDTAAGSFVVMGSTVTTDTATVWADANGVPDLVAGSVVQVWGLPAAPGTLRATRIQMRPASVEPLATGTVQNLDRSRQTFTLGLLTVGYGTATLESGIDATTLANGVIVRVRGTLAPIAGNFIATKVQSWYAIPSSDGMAVQLAGVITDFVSRSGFRVLGTPIDATNAQITGGPAYSLGNGVKVEVDGFMTGGVLVVKKLRIKYVPGTGGPASFTLIGTIGAYQSPADFNVQRNVQGSVRGQPVNASGTGVTFENGTVADLRNGKGVTIVGDKIDHGVLIAQRVTFNVP